MMFPNKRLRVAQGSTNVQSGQLNVARSEKINNEYEMEQKLRLNGRNRENTATWNKRRCTMYRDVPHSGCSSRTTENQNNLSSEKKAIEDLTLPHGLKPPMLTRKRTDPYLSDMRSRVICSVEF
mmetsp:Transcript_26919/g.37572  ORF Transcript_26919/g.37572 Transcript_26919/m.37572 type:complete len:124 (+) Transcript_26919:91-462(+)|eukprot:CAMPEP_0185253148 /NCGR_PEP_ID=MMETSP1359-20130426/2023_1 /TAXON_ID=552665 /ORGANISM="Bigelowiella longifila, Strain CCMP242" /LENGTH=123 /DNA_ID=CAMNT_0027835481 /DNA_START=39 /DNA_END=410 /DNA_ORIENTATION=+